MLGEIPPFLLVLKMEWRHPCALHESTAVHPWDRRESTFLLPPVRACFMVAHSLKPSAFMNSIAVIWVLRVLSKGSGVDDLVSSLCCCYGEWQNL